VGNDRDDVIDLVRGAEVKELRWSIRRSVAGAEIEA
jgi:hypothetical protein